MSTYLIQLGMAGKKTRARAKQILGSVPVPHQTDPLEGVMFASPQAEEYAREIGLTWKDFASTLIEASSEKGYTKSDVYSVAHSQG
jgi:hypothetical protein